MIQIGSLLLTCAVALVGIFYDTHDARVRYVLASLALMALVFSILIQVQSGRQSAFNKRALENLIRASTPSDLFARAVTQLGISVALKKQITDCVVVRRQVDDGFIVQLVFPDESSKAIRGYFEFNHEKLAEWSLLDEKELKTAISHEMFSPFFSKEVFDKWNDLCEWFGQLSRGLYPDSVRNGRFGISARTDLKRIGVPWPSSAAVNPEDDRVEMLTLGSQKVPFLMFSEANLIELAGESRMQGAERVSRWLIEAWGNPSILGSERT